MGGRQPCFNHVVWFGFRSGRGGRVINALECFRDVSESKEEKQSFFFNFY